MGKGTPHYKTSVKEREMRPPHPDMQPKLSSVMLTKNVSYLLCAKNDMSIFTIQKNFMYTNCDSYIKYTIMFHFQKVQFVLM